MSRAAGKKGAVRDRGGGGVNVALWEQENAGKRGRMGEIWGEYVHGVGVKISERRRIPGQRNGEVCWGVITVMQLSAKRGHVCAADSLVLEDINIL